ncbi:MAG: ATP-binding protein [Candidatus Krumholzibacteriia bacterium]
MIGSLSNYRGNIRFWLKSYLFIGVALLTLGVLLYSNRVIGRMEEQSAATTRLFSRFIAEVVLEVQDEGKRSLLQEVVGEIQLPVVLTDVDGRPFAWHRVGVDPPTEADFANLAALDPADPPPGKMKALVDRTRKMDRSHPPIAIHARGSGDVLAYVHFGLSRLQRELRLMPFIQLALFLVFMGVGLQGFRYLKLSEQRSIWVGMAKETAHQLGTPLSALLGWTQLLRDQVAEGRSAEIGKSVDEMDEDLHRLSKVTERFSKIGSQPELKSISISEVLERTVKYFHRRLPRLKADSTLTLEFEETPIVRGNEELLEWVFENLIKNGLDALGEKGGTIAIQTRYDASKQVVEIMVRDSGRGVPAALRQRIFSPGFTTKRRGWGLGLALTRRIVEDYHGGDLKLAETGSGKGTTFVVRFPAS